MCYIYIESVTSNDVMLLRVLFRIQQHVVIMYIASIDIAVLRLAVVYLPKDCPNYWEVITKFSLVNSAASGIRARARPCRPWGCGTSHGNPI